MADKKMTRVEALAIAIEVVENAEAVEVLEKIKASIEKKNASGSSKPKKATEAQTYLRNEILRVLEENGAPLSVTEILDKVDRENAPADTKFSTSSVTANIGVMLVNGKTPNENGKIYRSMVGKTAKFSLENTEVGEE